MFGIVGGMSNLRERINEGIAESEVKVGAEHFYRTTTLKEVLSWLDDTPASTSSEKLPARLVCGTGTGEFGDYEIVRRVRAKEYRLEYVDSDKWTKISLAEAVDLVQDPKLGQPGLTAFDKAYLKAQES